MTDPSHTPADSRPDALCRAVGATCHRLQRDYFADASSSRSATARASLAELRRGASFDIEHDPLALGRALFLMGEDFEEQLAGKGDAPSLSERSAFLALTLFGLHMQSAQEPAHVPGTSFATACGKLHALQLSDSIKPRIDAMLLAHSEQARIVHIRSIVSLLRGHALGFDYGLLARDLRSLSHPERRAGVQLRWGRDFARGAFTPRNATPNTTTTEPIH